MVFKSKWISALAGTSFLLFFLISCEQEIDTLGDGVIGDEPFVTDRADFDVFAVNKRITAVQTNRLPLYQAGVYNDPVYGRRQAIITSQLTLANLQGNPEFGNLSQAEEDRAETDEDNNTIDENETVKEVFLYLPYQLTPALNNDLDRDGIPDELESPEDRNNPNSDQDGDGLTDQEESLGNTDPFNADTDGDMINDNLDEDTQANLFANRFSLDSIFSGRFSNLEDQSQYLGETFTLKVERSSFFLRDFNPEENFERPQEYFSNSDITTFVEGDLLFEGVDVIDSNEIVFFNDDDPETEENESLTIETRLSPGVRVPLDPDFFQRNILQNEGNLELSSQANFSNFLRGLHITLTPSNEDLMILFDLSQANITITYEYQDYTEVDGVGSIETVEDEYVLGFLQNVNNLTNGNAVNTLIDEPLPANIESNLDTENNAERLYLKGGSGSYVEINLFGEDGGQDIINQIRQNNWIINEANLIFYVDRETLDNVGGTIEPPRLYLFNSENNTPLFNAATELDTDANFSLRRLLNYDGLLNRNSNNQGEKYTVRITEYMNDIISGEVDNVPLRLALTSNLTIISVLEAQRPMSEVVDLPVMHTINPLGTVLYGNNVSGEDEDKKLKLQIFYTETN